MDTYFSVLPTDVLQCLSSPLKVAGGQEPIKSLSRFLRLPHPRTRLPALFFPTEWPPDTAKEGSKTGILEVQATCPPDERSWILDEGFIADGRMLTMTPFDPTFLLLPLIQVPKLVTDLQANGSSETQFRTSDDIFESVAMKFDNDVEARAKYLRDDITRFCALECTRKALLNLCETREVSSTIVVYRYSSTKTMTYLRGKIDRLAASPAFDNSRTNIRQLAKDGLMDDGQEHLLKLGRQRACCELIAQYLPPDVREAIMSSYDFTSLQKYLESKKVEDISVPSASKTAKKAQGKEKEPSTSSKKRKSVKASQGVESLKKVNTAGMAKISSFFNKQS